MTRKSFTFVLNLETASSETYQTWVTVRRNGSLLERKSNENGNGQQWVVFGYVSNGDTKLFKTNDTETQAARIMSHIVRKVGRKCNVGGYGAAWSKATVVRETVNPSTGRVLTAAPSIRNGEPTRDKNVNAMRRKVDGIDMAAEMAKRTVKRTARRIWHPYKGLKVSG